MRAGNVGVRPHGFVGIHVHGAHEPSRLVCADRQDTQIERPLAARDLAELRMIRGVTGEIDGVPTGAQRPPAPEGAHAIEGRATTRVLRRHAGDAQVIGVDGVPPIELGHGARAPAPNVARDAERREPARGWMAACDGANGPGVEMVVVVVREEHDVDRGQRVEREPGCR